MTAKTRADGEARYRTLLLMTIPVVLSTISTHVLATVDRLMVSELGEEAVAAHGVGNTIILVLMATVAGLAPAVIGLAAPALGAKNLRDAGRVVSGVLQLGLVFSIPVAAATILLAPWLCTLIIESSDIAGLASAYTRSYVLGYPAIAVDIGCSAYWFASKRTSLLLKLTILTQLANVFLNWVLIFGNLGMPALGIAGAGLGSAIAVGGRAILQIWLIRATGTRLSARFRPASARQVAAIAVPSSIEPVAHTTGLLVFFGLAAHVGDGVLAAATVIHTYMIFPHFCARGAGSVAAAVTMRAVGRDEARVVRETPWRGVAIAMGLSAAFGVPVALDPDFILELFLETPGLVRAAALPMAAMALTMIVDAAGTALSRVLASSGSAWFVVRAEVFSFWGVGLPLAFVLADQLDGLVGLWAAFITYRLALTSAVIMRFARTGVAR